MAYVSRVVRLNARIRSVVRTNVGAPVAPALQASSALMVSAWWMTRATPIVRVRTAVMTVAVACVAPVRALRASLAPMGSAWPVRGPALVSSVGTMAVVDLVESARAEPSAPWMGSADKTRAVPRTAQERSAAMMAAAEAAEAVSRAKLVWGEPA